MPQRRRTAEENAARGNPGKRKQPMLATDVLPPMDVMPPVPITAEAALIWKLSAPDLIALKILRTTDALTFSILCESYARYQHALKVLLKDGDIQRVKTVAGGYMMRRHPMVQVLNHERAIVMDYAGKFGMTSVDRANLMAKLALAAGLPPGAEQPFLTDDVGDDDDQPAIEAKPLPDAGPVGYLG